MAQFFSNLRRCPICDTVWDASQYGFDDENTDNDDICPDCRSEVAEAICDFDEWEETLLDDEDSDE